MAYYRAGEIIRLNRIALGMTQEELSEDICSVETLSRIENGHHKVKKNTYKRLMERMNRMPEKNYAICTTNDMGLLEEDFIIRNFMVNHDYKRAEVYLHEMEQKIGTDVISQQHLKRIKAVIYHENKKICTKKYIKELEETLAMTVPNYEKYIDGIYPFTEQEAYIVLNIAGGYGDERNHEKCLQIYQMLLRCVDAEYMDAENGSILKVIVTRNMCCQFGPMKRYQEAIELSQKNYEECLSIGYDHMLPVICGDIAWNMMKQIEEGERDMEDIVLVKKYLRQAYYAAAAKEMDVFCNATKEYWNKKIYGE